MNLAALFPDSEIDAVRSGRKTLSPGQYHQLIADLLTMEENQRTKAELMKMGDIELMDHAVYCWSEYCKSQGLI